METPENTTKNPKPQKTLKSISNQRQPPEPPTLWICFIFSSPFRFHFFSTQTRPDFLLLNPATGHQHTTCIYQLPQNQRPRLIFPLRLDFFLSPCWNCFAPTRLLPPYPSPSFNFLPPLARTEKEPPPPLTQPSAPKPSPVFPLPAISGLQHLPSTSSNTHTLPPVHFPSPSLSPFPADQQPSRTGPDSPATQHGFPPPVFL